MGKYIFNSLHVKLCNPQSCVINFSVDGYMRIPCYQNNGVTAAEMNTGSATACGNLCDFNKNCIGFDHTPEFIYDCYLKATVGIDTYDAKVTTYLKVKELEPIWQT